MPCPFTLSWPCCACPTPQGRNMSLYSFLLGCASMRDPVPAMCGKETNWFWTGRVSDDGIFGGLCLVSTFLENWSHGEFLKPSSSHSSQKFTKSTNQVWWNSDHLCFFTSKFQPWQVHQSLPAMGCRKLICGSCASQRLCAKFSRDQAGAVHTILKQFFTKSVSKQFFTKTVSQHGGMCNGSFALKLVSLPPFIIVWWCWWENILQFIWCHSNGRSLSQNQESAQLLSGDQLPEHVMSALLSKTHVKGVVGLVNLSPYDTWVELSAMKWGKKTNGETVMPSLSLSKNLTVVSYCDRSLSLRLMQDCPWSSLFVLHLMSESMFQWDRWIRNQLSPDQS